MKKNVIFLMMAFIIAIVSINTATAQSQDEATIYLIHKYKYVGSLGKCVINVDGDQVGITKCKKYIEFMHNSGDVVITTNFANSSLPGAQESSMNLKIEGGEKYYILIEYKQTGLIKATYSMQRIGEEEANKYINKYEKVK